MPLLGAVDAGSVILIQRYNSECDHYEDDACALKGVEDALLTFVLEEVGERNTYDRNSRR